MVVLIALIELYYICSLNSTLVSDGTLLAENNLVEKIVKLFPSLPSLAKLVSLPVLAQLASHQLLDVLHVRVDLDILCSQGAEQQLVALLGLKGGGQGQERNVINLEEIKLVRR